MLPAFKVIGVLGSTKNASVLSTLKALIHYLTQSKRLIILETETAQLLKEPYFKAVERTAFHQYCDLLIVVGGDGSLLDAVQTAIQKETPILGINRGRLGFLTDIRPTELDKIEAILSGEYKIEKRFLLTATIEHHGEIIACGNALNEVSFTPAAIPQMYEFEIYIDKQFVCSQEADGLIIATPTGSTAYALSGGGPILHPTLDAMVIVPMFPHTLTMRPIVINGNQQIKILVTSQNTAAPRLSCDSQFYVQTLPGSQIIIQKKTQFLHLVHPLDYDYYETLRSKLHWGHKLK